METPERKPLVMRQFYRVINPEASDYTRICLWVGVITKEDDPDVSPCRIVRFADGPNGAFWKEELEPYEP